MKIKNLLTGFILITLTAFVVPSCSKVDTEGIPGEDISLAMDESYVDALFNDVDNLAMTEIKALDENGYATGQMKSTFTDVCYTVTVDHPDSTTFPKIITLDFGDGCSAVFNGDTITRSGQVVISITGRWFMPGAQHIMSFNNFYFNGAKIEGTRTITNEGWYHNRLEISIELENGKVTFDGGRYITRTASHNWLWALHLDPRTDTIYVTGTASGINVSGDEYVRTITDDLILVRCSDQQYRWGFAGDQWILRTV